jgi:hypothetical protein
MAGIPLYDVGSAATMAFNFECGHGAIMRITLNIVATLLVLAGVGWFLQGINVLPGSFMTGQTRWAVYGGIAFAIGLALFLRANWPRKEN